MERLLKNYLEILGLGSVPFHNSGTLHYSELMFYHVWNDKRKVVGGSLVLRMAQMGANMSEGGFRIRDLKYPCGHGYWCLHLPVPLTSSSELLVIDVNASSLVYLQSSSNGTHVSDAWGRVTYFSPGKNIFVWNICYMLDPTFSNLKFSFLV